ncbi:VOC family protein [Pseudoalteromonas xiamenensis]|uniref:VOC family protein n=1 Tax=Pseudoalteromonas xiamenensis TaxID=882626 RepID=A0A975DIL5_9GAMM|nr:VOC family protein [Pseudoalteromonas xiamenensis]QTH72541.1 VOC family protein [Pseudoalteromonas xiamenensis]
MLKRIHHIAVIGRNYEKSKWFYCEVLGFSVLAEHYQAHRDSYKIDLVLPSLCQLELFIFKSAPPRPSFPEALGLRHLAFEVDNLDEEIERITRLGIESEAVRIDPYTNKRFCFFADPDGLPIELYETN